jgi:hypothetical protein
MAADPELRNVQMPETQRSTFDSLARNADEMQFGVSVAQWVAQAYPQAIDALEMLGRHSQFSELAQSALPEMKSQLSDAQRILQSARNQSNGQPTATGAVTDPKKNSD